MTMLALALRQWFDDGIVYMVETYLTLPQIKPREIIYCAPSCHGQKPTGPRPKRICIWTWNVLHDCLAINGLSGDDRYSKICDLVLTRKPDVVCLQEVTPTFLKCAEAALSSCYFFSFGSTTGGSQLVSRYGQLTLSLWPFGTRVWASTKKSEKRILLSTFGDGLVVANVHLSARKSEAHQRSKQLSYLEALLSGAHKCIVAGDFNFAPPEDKYLPFGSAVPVGGLASSFDVVRNKIAAKLHSLSESGLYDRVFGRGVSFASTRLLLDYEYSDHYGIETMSMC